MVTVEKMSEKTNRLAERNPMWHTKGLSMPLATQLTTLQNTAKPDPSAIFYARELIWR